MALKITSSIPYKKGEETGSTSETYLVIERFYCSKEGEVVLPVRCFKSQDDRNEVNGWDNNKVENFISKNFVFQLTAQEMEGGLMATSYGKIKTKLEEIYTVKSV